MKSTVLLFLLAFGLVARAAAADLAPAGVVMFDHAQLDAAFAKGLPLLFNSGYKVSAGRRVVPGLVELHEHDTDLLYVTEGTATFITGGTMVDAKATGPGEYRGTSITGGVIHHLTKGDLIVIPTGTPHLFSQVDGTFLYLIIKVTK